MDNQVVSVDFRKGISTETLKVGKSGNCSRITNDLLRGKRHLSEQELENVCKAIRKGSRYAERDELMVLVAFYHALRVGELVGVLWQHLNLGSGQIAIKRKKNGIDTMHPIVNKRELMLLRRLHREQGKPNSGYVFRNERGGAVTANGFQKMMGKFSELALGVKWNAHALRHGCGTALIDRGHDIRTVQVFMGHRNIQNTTVYLHESVKQFEKIEW